MKIQNREKPFWAWRARHFRIIRVVDVSVKEGATYDYVATTVGYGELIPLRKVEETVSYSTLAHAYMDITSAHINVKRMLLKTVLTKI